MRKNKYFICKAFVFFGLHSILVMIYPFNKNQCYLESFTSLKIIVKPQQWKCKDWRKSPYLGALQISNTHYQQFYRLVVNNSALNEGCCAYNMYSKGFITHSCTRNLKTEYTAARQRILQIIIYLTYSNIKVHDIATNKKSLLSRINSNVSFKKFHLKSDPSLLYRYSLRHIIAKMALIETFLFN